MIVGDKFEIISRGDLGQGQTSMMQIVAKIVNGSKT